MDVSGNILILSKDALTSTVLETLKENLPEFAIVNINPDDISTAELDEAVLAVGDNESLALASEKFRNFKKFPPALLMTDDPMNSTKESLQDFIYDTFGAKDSPQVVYRRVRNALYFSIKSKDREKSIRDREVDEAEQIQKVLKVSKNLIPLRDTESSIIRIITSATSILNCDGGMVFLVDNERNAFTGFNLKHAEKGIIDSYQEFELEEGIPGWVYANKELYICNDPSFDNLFSDEFDKRFNMKSETVMAYPLITDETVVGVLRVYNKKAGGEFSKADGLLLRELSDIATQIILNTNYFENHSNFFTQAIKLLVIALEAHDEYFKLHSDSVTTYVDKMAEVLDLSLEDSLSLHFAAIFHDIGKLRIDSKILTKDTPLTQIEKKRMSLHSIAGEELLKGIKIFNNSTELIRHHHEWYNGSGFPDGLTGDNIPFGSRIIHICEAYDSMTSLYLPHRTPLDTDEASQELRSYSGAQFDPELVEVFITKVLNQ